MIFKNHYTVLKNEAIEYLNIKKDGIYVDMTGGAGGHSREILKRLEKGFLYIFDQDKNACDLIYENLKDYKNFKVINSNFRHIKKMLAKENIFNVDGILFDLGLSSMQIDNKDRGFSYMQDSILDMRMNQDQELTAKDIINSYEYDKLVEIFFKYGEENNSKIIAKKIIQNRPINTTKELVDICDMVNFKNKGHSAKRIFQALRIETNDELGSINEALVSSLELLNKNGRIVCITFHSLEDKLVKQIFSKYTKQEIIKGIPIAVEKEMDYILINKKIILPTEKEIEENIRSHSAKMRVIERVNI